MWTLDNLLEFKLGFHTLCLDMEKQYEWVILNVDIFLCGFN